MIWMVRSKGDLLCWESKFIVLFGWQSSCWVFFGMGKGDEKRMWEGNYFFIHFILLMKKKHFCLVSFFKQSGKEPLLILRTIMMKIGFKKLILLLPSLHQLYGKSYMYRADFPWVKNPLLETSSPPASLRLLCCVPYPTVIMSNNNEKQGNIQRIKLLKPFINMTHRTLGLTLGSMCTVYRQRPHSEQSSVHWMWSSGSIQDPNVQKSTRNFLHFKVLLWTCKHLTLFFTVFTFTSYLHYCIICLYRWSEAMQLLTVFSFFFQTLKPSLFGEKGEKKI